MEQTGRKHAAAARPKCRAKGRSRAKPGVLVPNTRRSGYARLAVCTSLRCARFIGHFGPTVHVDADACPTYGTVPTFDAGKRTLTPGASYLAKGNVPRAVSHNKLSPIARSGHSTNEEWSHDLHQITLFFPPRS